MNPTEIENLRRHANRLGEQVGELQAQLAKWQQIAANQKEKITQLTAACQPLAQIPIEDFGFQNKPERTLVRFNEHIIFVSHILNARNAIQATS